MTLKFLISDILLQSWFKSALGKCFKVSNTIDLVVPFRLWKRQNLLGCNVHDRVSCFKFEGVLINDFKDL